MGAQGRAHGESRHESTAARLRAPQPKRSMRQMPEFFAKPADFRKWLQQHHASATYLCVGCYKTKSGKPSITWPQSVDQALCFGWIDGIRKSIDAESYMIRFT